MHPQFLEWIKNIACPFHSSAIGRMGYLSSWANDQFSTTSEKNEFYAQFGEVFSPRGDEALQNELKDTLGSDEVMSFMEKVMSA